MFSQIPVTELEEKTIEELREMLADEALLSLDDDLSSDLILKITEVIIKKENKTDEQRETERIAFWARLLANHGSRLPIRLEDVVKKSNETAIKRDLSSNKYRKVQIGQRSRRLAVIAAVLLLIFIGNTISVYAFNFNALHAIVAFTDNIFSKTFVSKEDDGTHTDTLSEETDSGVYESFQDALDVYGITEVKAPTWLPDNYHYVGVQVSDTTERDIIASMYKNGEKLIVITVIKYSEFPDGQSRTFEKSEGVPSIFAYNGIDHYIFTNLDRTMATWTIEMSEFDVQGEVSLEEIKLIIESMYMED